MEDSFWVQPVKNWGYQVLIVMSLKSIWPSWNKCTWFCWSKLSHNNSKKSLKLGRLNKGSIEYLLPYNEIPQMSLHKCMYVHDLTRVYVLPSVCMKEEQKRFVVVSSHYVCNYQKQNCSPDLLLSSSICNAHILLQNYRELTSRGSRWLLAPTNLVIYWTLKQQFFKSFYGPACIFSCEKSYTLSRYNF